ncbi:MAG TPA: glyoxalase/bleomycin resistance/extradiol dioxygenase family protein [Bryobacteraceae bacterium]|nr:glyoxalase/bleomycin resistance/extradiol dioxygenase family protein [Bryobacteraceae bacterium]
MLTVEPYIFYKGNCREAMEFYKSAVGAEILFSQTVGESPMSGMSDPNNIMHATIKIGNSTLMMSDNCEPGDVPTGTQISLAIGLRDTAKAKEIFDNLAEGGSITMPLEKTFWAESFGMLTDKFGVKWLINSEAPRPTE